MVLFKTYKTSRIVKPGFLMKHIMHVKSYGDYYSMRIWNATYTFLLPGDVRFYVAGIPFIYLIHRWHNDHNLEPDGVEKVVMKRWGGTVEDMRRLSPEDQLRARTFTEIEHYYSTYAPKDLANQPEGSMLPNAHYYASKSGNASSAEVAHAH